MATALSGLEPGSEKKEGNTPEPLRDLLRRRGNLLNSIPSMPATVQTLLEELQLPADEVDIFRVTELIARDKSLTAQCLRMANSPLFGRGEPTTSVRAAVRTLGISKIGNIAVSCTVMNVGRSQKALDPLIFWQHSLGCAILSRKLARSVGYKSPEEAYLGGLLHDIGYVVNFVLLPQEMQAALEESARNGTFFGDKEQETFGFTHCDSGEVLAQKWHFAPEIIDVIRHHHDASEATVNPSAVAIVSLADRLCRSLGLGLGYVEATDPVTNCNSDWEILSRFCPEAARMNWDDFAADATNYFQEIKDLVKAMSGTQ